MADQRRGAFLSEASQLLFASSSSTSAYLSSQRVTLERAQQPRSNFKGACAGCGTLALPGLTVSDVKKHSPENAKRGKPRAASHPAPTRSLRRQKCNVCGRITTSHVDKSKKAARSSTRQDTEIDRTKIPLEAKQAPASQQHQEPKSMSVNSKKRAKARKDREGLQALLNKNKQPSTKADLNLMDFMRT